MNNFKVPDRNIGYRSRGGAYTNIWQQQPPSMHVAPVRHVEPEPTPSRNEILIELSKKSVKDVREWFREQIEMSESSESD